MGVHIAQLVQAEEGGEEEEEEIPVTRSCASRKIVVKSDQEGKGVASSVEKAKKIRCLKLARFQEEKEIFI